MRMRRLLFSFSLCMKIMNGEGRLNASEACRRAGKPRMAAATSGLTAHICRGKNRDVEPNMTAFLKKLATRTCALSNLQARFLMAGPTGEVKARCKNCRFIEPAPDQRDVVSIAALETFFHTRSVPLHFLCGLLQHQLLRGHSRVSFPFGWGVLTGNKGQPA